MKKAITLGIFCLLSGVFIATAQVSISEDGSPPDNSAILDVKSTSKGILLPHLTLGKADSLNNMAEGLWFYCTTLKRIIMWNGDRWMNGDGDYVFRVGDSAMGYGGYVAYLYPNGLEALIVADINSTADPVNWGCPGISIGGTNAEIGTGQANNSWMQSGCPQENAAVNCLGWSHNGFNDWYLPASYELYAAIVNTDLGWVQTSGSAYWSSTEGSAGGAFAVSAYDGGGNMSIVPKSVQLKVRCVRSTYIDRCSPQPTYPNAGPDQINIQGSSTILQANIPGSGTAHWNIFSGDGGVIADSIDPSSAFSGIAGVPYYLMWSISTTCNTLTDLVRIRFGCPVANAGPDQLDIQDTSVTLQGNTPFDGSGLWSIVSGSGGSITDPSDPSSNFSGIEGNSYVLKWTVTSDCPLSFDHVTISFACPTANAGPDQLNLTSLTTTLQGGNTPFVGTGHWHLISGTGGNIADTLNPASSFNGIEGITYTLRWTIISSCPPSHDTVVISFACPTAFSGPDQVDVTGTATSLQAATLFAGTGLWTIVSGSGGSVTTPSDPVSNFTGVPGCMGYTLRWTVTSNCTSVYDDVLVNFACSPMPTVANAGADQANVAGATTTLQGNAADVGTTYWTLMSGANGIIAQPSNPASLFTGTNGTSYVLKWTITNSCCTTVDYVTISFAAFSCGNSFQDTRDGKAYTTVLEGSQCWMKQNLNFAASGSACYAGNPTNCDNYGRLYDWTMASTACPTGWHLPTDGEWCTLASGLDGSVSCGLQGVLGTDAGGKMKETGTTYWQTPNTGATNSSGFSARGGGTTTISGHNLTQWGSFWTATTNGSNRWSWEMTYNDARIWRTPYGTSNTMSVRCLKN